MGQLHRLPCPYGYEKAKVATTTAEKLAFLRPLQHTSGMNPELQATVEIVCNLCSAEATVESIAEYIFYQPQAAVLASEWFPNTCIGVIGRLIAETPQPLTGVPYDELAEAAAAITDANLHDALKSQVAKEVVGFVVDTVDQPRACLPLVQSALHRRGATRD